MDDAFERAREFLLKQGRLLEQRLYATYFKESSPAGVVDALRGYQNEDGGFGHSLEPDKRCPSSLPIDVETAFLAMASVNATDQNILSSACDYLAGVADGVGAKGAVPLALPVIEHFPRAAHWSDWTYVPGMNPTGGLVGALYQLEFDHAWREEAARYCWSEVEANVIPDGVHTLLESLRFLEFAPERARAEACAYELATHFDEVEGVLLDPSAEGYGLGPLHFAPLATSRWQQLFSDNVISANLEHLASAQLDDGGWAISWDPPSESARWEWRGIVTLQALRTLVSYDVLDLPEGHSFLNR